MKNPHDSHATLNQSTRGTQGRWTTKLIAMSALFCAIAIVLSFVSIPLFPAAPYLKYDPSNVVSLIAGFAFGPAVSSMISVLMWLPHVFSNPFGAIVGCVSTLTMSLPAALIYRRHATKKGMVAALVLGSIISVASCIAANLVITPLYTAMPIETIVALIPAILLPFNLLKAVLNSIFTFVIYKNISKILGSSC